MPSRAPKPIQTIGIMRCFINLSVAIRYPIQVPIPRDREQQSKHWS